jgi:hypothetical protein
LAQSCHSFLRFRRTAGKGVTGSCDAHCIRKVRLLMHCFFRPCGGMVVATGTEMSECDIRLPHEYAGIKRAKAHRTRRVIYRDIRFAETELYEAAGGPSEGEVRVQGEGPRDSIGTVVERADDITEGEPSIAEGDCVISSTYAGQIGESINPDFRFRSNPGHRPKTCIFRADEAATRLILTCESVRVAEGCSQDWYRAWTSARSTRPLRGAASPIRARWQSPWRRLPCRRRRA